MATCVLRAFRALQGGVVKQLLVEPVPPLRAGFGDLANGNLFGFWCVAFHALTGIVSVEHGHDSALNIAVFVD